MDMLLGILSTSYETAVMTLAILMGLLVFIGTIFGGLLLVAVAALGLYHLALKLWSKCNE